MVWFQIGCCWLQIWLQDPDTDIFMIAISQKKSQITRELAIIDCGLTKWNLGSNFLCDFHQCTGVV